MIIGMMYIYSTLSEVSGLPRVEIPMFANAKQSWFRRVAVGAAALATVAIVGRGGAASRRSAVRPGYAYPYAGYAYPAAYPYYPYPYYPYYGYPYYGYPVGINIGWGWGGWWGGAAAGAGSEVAGSTVVGSAVPGSTVVGSAVVVAGSTVAAAGSTVAAAAVPPLASTDNRDPDRAAPARDRSGGAVGASRRCAAGRDDPGTAQPLSGQSPRQLRPCGRAPDHHRHRPAERLRP